MMVYFATFGGLFFIKNFWRLVSADYYRLILIYLGWIACITAWYGGKVGDIWYLGTEFVVFVAVGIAWCLYIKEREDLRNFNKMLAWAAVPVTLLQLISPLVINEVFEGGRFIGMLVRSTRFGVIYSVFVLMLFWMAMYESKANLRRFFLVLAILGYGMILLSGTRNATVATLAGIAILWWVFRSKIFVYMGFVAVVGLLVTAIIGGPGANVETVTERLQSLDSSRYEAWIAWLEVGFRKPIIGYGFEGLAKAFYPEELLRIISSFRRISAPPVHNNFIGFFCRWGVIGLAIFLAVFYFPFRQAWKVIFNDRVPLEDKKLYVLPVALLAQIFLEGLFEDTIGGSGKGNIHNVLFGICPILLYVYGARLLAAAESGDDLREPDQVALAGAEQLKARGE